MSADSDMASLDGQIRYFIGQAYKTREKIKEHRLRVMFELGEELTSSRT
jgi:hypothetical protein